MDILYINLYLIKDRSIRGKKYRQGVPLASIPITAKRKQGHDSSCWNCNCARDIRQDTETGKSFSFCKVLSNIDKSNEYYETIANQMPDEYHLVPKSMENVRAVEKELKKYFTEHGNKIEIFIEESFASTWPVPNDGDN